MLQPGAGAVSALGGIWTGLTSPGSRPLECSTTAGKPGDRATGVMGHGLALGVRAGATAGPSRHE